MSSGSKSQPNEIETGAGLKRIDLEAGRRAFIRSAGLGLAGAAVFGGAAATSTPAKAAVSSVDILNFALNLEYLEAEFYLRAATGSGLTDSETSGTGTQGTVSGGSQVPFATRDFSNYAIEIANDERRHVNTLRAALGSSAVSEPSIDLNMSFTEAARAAGLVSSDQTFDAFANETNFLLAAFIFEDVGVTAYNGAAPLLDPAYLPTAASILAVEAYHAGIIRTVLYSLKQFAPARKISEARNSLDGPTNDDQSIGNSNQSNLVPASIKGLAYSRNTTQVLDIVYLNANASPGGFFPNGMNGAIK